MVGDIDRGVEGAGRGKKAGDGRSVVELDRTDRNPNRESGQELSSSTTATAARAPGHAPVTISGRAGDANLTAPETPETANSPVPH